MGVLRRYSSFLRMIQFLIFIYLVNLHKGIKDYGGLLQSGISKIINNNTDNKQLKFQIL